MSQMVGADVAELRELAASFDDKAAALRTIENQVSWRIHSAPWHGSDVQRFQHDWNTRHRRSIITAATSMASAAQVLRANADQQELASDATYSGRVPTVGRTGTPAHGLGADGLERTREGWLSRALDAVGTAVSIADIGVGVVEVGQYFHESLPGGISAGKIADFIRETGEPLSKLGKVGAWLGPIGAIFDIGEMSEDAGRGDGWGMALSGSSALLGTVAWGATMFAAIGVGGAVMATAAPILGAAALAVGVGSLIYHNWDGITDFVGGAGRTIAKANEWAASKVVELGSAAVSIATQKIDGAVRDVGRIADSFTNAGTKFVEGIFRKPAWAPW